MFGDFISAKIGKLNYYNILKSNFSFQYKSENKDFFVSTLSKEFFIKEKIEKNYSKVAEEKNDVKEENVEVNELEPKEEVIIEKKIVETPISLPTEVIQANNLVESYNTTYNSVKIKNETNFNLTQNILIPDIEFENRNDIVIFHTHTCESYTSTKENSYVASREL